MRPATWLVLGFVFFVVPVGAVAQAQRALVNLSARVRVTGTGDTGANFTIEGSFAKTVLIRALGPAMQPLGFSDALPDPVLRLHDGDGSVIATNAAWGGTAVLKAALNGVGAFGALEDNSKDAVLLLPLNPRSYSVTVTSASGVSGSVLLEIYETDTNARFAYLATRAVAGPGPNALAAGFVVGGSTPAQFLIRALGPSLIPAGVGGATSQPTLTILQGSTTIATNTLWGGNPSVVSASATAGLIPLTTNSRDAALLVTLAPGAYVAHVSGVEGGGGYTILEMAQIDADRATTSAPAMLVPLRDITVAAGTPVTLGAPAIGRPTPAFQWLKNGVPIPRVGNFSSYTLGAPTTGADPSHAGSYSVIMTSSAGTTVSAPSVVTVVIAPVITTQPLPRNVPQGDTAILTVVATGGALSYQWLRDGASLTGATQATLTLPNVQSSLSGTYTVRVSNLAGTITSNPAALNVIDPRLAILTHPRSQTVNSGEPAAFSVVAIGDTPLRYQWLYNGAIIGGATNATFSVASALTATAGTYAVVVSNAAGTATSNSAALTVRPRPLAGVYFGNFPSGAQNAGTFAMLVRPDGTGVFLGFLSPTRQALVARSVQVETDRTFRFTATALGGTGPAEYQLEGAITEDGRELGSIMDISLALNAPAPRSLNTSLASAGFYQGGAGGSSALTYLIVSAGGEAYGITVSGATADAGHGTVSTTGALDLTTESGRIIGNIDGAVAAFSMTNGSNPAIAFVAANNEARSDFERLVNVSTRSQTGTGPDALIVGFVITGTQSRLVLVRGIGPTLANFSVGNPLSAVRLEVFRGSTLLAQGGDWGADAAASQVATAAARVNAFALPANSRDAALLLPLQPGAYTAVVSGQGGATGVSLAEIYDASTGPDTAADRIVNVATRSLAGAGDRTLIAGFVVTGLVPKRVLVRGVGPTLASFGVTGILARPQLAVYSGATVLARNAGWMQSLDVAAIATAGREAGAFTLNSSGNDAALILNLAPGAYSAQVSGVAGEIGVALIELYELP